MIKFIITDFDGTLFDTREANKMSYKKAFEEYNVMPSMELYDKAFGLRFDDMCNALGVTENKMVRDKIKIKKAKYYKEYAGVAKPNEWLLAMIKDLNKKGIKTIVATTARKENVNTILAHHNVHKSTFYNIITGEDVSNGKPDPEVYIKALECCGCSPEEVLVFEDTDTGVKAANAAGISNVIKVV